MVSEMTTVPGVLPPTVPVVRPTVAMARLEEPQWPPGVASERVMKLRTHTLDGPVMGAGGGLTVNVSATMQPLGAE